MYLEACPGEAVATEGETARANTTGWLPDLLGAALSPGALVLALAHGVAGAIFLLSTNYDLELNPISKLEAIVAALTIAGLVAAMVGAASVAWQLAAVVAGRATRRLRATRRRTITAERWAMEQIGRHGALTLVLVAILWVQIRFMGSGDVVAGVFTSLWFCAALSCGAVRLLAAGWPRMRGQRTRISAALLDEQQPLPTADSLLDVAPPTWTFLVVVEGIFHHGAGTWVPMAEISALLRNMADEAEAMILGPEAGRLAGLIGAFVVVAVLWAVGWRLWGLSWTARRSPRWRRRLPAVWAALIVVGLAGMLVSGPRLRRLTVHHSHPSLHQIARLLGPSLAVALRAEEPHAAAAAARLFPHVLDANGLPDEAPAPLPNPATGSDQPLARNALIIFIDTISRRHLEPWGYGRAVSPHMSRLAAESIRFDRARSNGSQTDLSTIALFYSLLPLAHLDKGETYARGHGGMPVHLHAAEAGLAVGVFSADWEVHQRGHGALHPKRCDAFVDARQAKDEGEAAEIVRWAGRREDKLVQRFLRWHDRVRASGRRTFSYVKLLRPHAPYYTPPDGPDWQRPFKPAADGYNVFDFRPSPARVPALLNRYDNAIHFADQAIGQLLDGLRRSGALDDTVVILLSDHGEAWGEHGIFGHSTQHFEEVLEVPLLVRLPSGRAAIDRRPVATIDVAPTLLDALGLAPDPHYQGRSLLNPDYRPRLHFAWSNNVGPIASLIVDDWKLIWIPATDERWLYHLKIDTAEGRNLAGTAEAAEHEAALLFLLHRLCRAQLRYIAGLPPTPGEVLARRLSTE